MDEFVDQNDAQMSTSTEHKEGISSKLDSMLNKLVKLEKEKIEISTRIKKIFRQAVHRVEEVVEKHERILEESKVKFNLEYLDPNLSIPSAAKEGMVGCVGIIRDKSGKLRVLMVYFSEEEIERLKGLESDEIVEYIRENKDFETDVKSVDTVGVRDLMVFYKGFQKLMDVYMDRIREKIEENLRFMKDVAEGIDFLESVVE